MKIDLNRYDRLYLFYGFRELADIRIHKYGYGLEGVVTHSPLVIDESHMFVRLVGTGNHNEGLVEVYVNGVWGTICDDGWTDIDAGVICTMMGFGRYKTILTVFHTPSIIVSW